MPAYMPEAKSVEWYTPMEIFKPLYDQYQFTLDVCARDIDAAMLPKFFTPEQDGLAQDWTGERRGAGRCGWRWRCVGDGAEVMREPRRADAA